MTAFSQWLSKLTMTGAERELIRATIAMAYLEGSAACLDEIGKELRS